jgi:hypothetical protein
LTTDRLEINPAFQCQKMRHPQSKMVMKAILTAMFTGVTLHLEQYLSNKCGKIYQYTF